MTETRADYDSPWKEILETYFTDFMAFFLPKIHAEKVVVMSFNSRSSNC